MKLYLYCRVGRVLHLCTRPTSKFENESKKNDLQDGNALRARNVDDTRRRGKEVYKKVERYLKQRPQAVNSSGRW